MQYTSSQDQTHKKVIDAMTRVKNFVLELDNEDIMKGKDKITGETSDGYHTFNELYPFISCITPVYLMSGQKQDKFKGSQEQKHADAELCFGGVVYCYCVSTDRVWYETNIKSLRVKGLGFVSMYRKRICRCLGRTYNTRCFNSFRRIFKGKTMNNTMNNTKCKEGRVI